MLRAGFLNTQGADLNTGTRKTRKNVFRLKIDWNIPTIKFSKGVWNLFRRRVTIISC